MTEDKGILIKNIYYMLTYAFRVLQRKNFEEVASENFEQIQDLFAALLFKGVSWQLKQGLYREYVTVTENLSGMRGKLNLCGTIENKIRQKRMLSCEHDELSANNIFNQILKTTMVILMRDPGVNAERRKDLKRALLFFEKIDLVEISEIRWSGLRYQRSSKNYEMLMNICYFVLNGMLQTTEKGHYKMAAFSESHMYRLYERFVLEYFKKHHSYLTEVKAAQVKWNLDPETEERMIRFLPVMQTDIFLRNQEKILIIDAKYYSRIMRKQYEKTTFHSANLYQIFTYVKNQDAAGAGNVSGLLLYAKTGETIAPDGTFFMGGSRIGVKSLDLNQEFSLIAARLDGIAKEYLA